MEENDDSSVCKPPPCWLFDECFDRSVGAGSNAETQEVAREMELKMEYQTAGEDRFEMQVDRAVLITSQSSLEINSASSSNRYHGELRAQGEEMVEGLIEGSNEEMVKFRVLLLVRMDQLHL